ncbi:hypothetical protein GWI33_002306 [Rhynchophorus ferrugineus]|uniref:Uncharacterized protein n=1 Tax=Rhynchophorus ferrugineus TaxID=354439 RepID=A0A834MJM7_RHYFE|nr:hypothetical protein GWI33_002306 [Rhynchophorus ferrugineus]
MKLPQCTSSILLLHQVNTHVQMGHNIEQLHFLDAVKAHFHLKYLLVLTQCKYQYLAVINAEYYIIRRQALGGLQRGLLSNTGYLNTMATLVKRRKNCW